MASTNPIPILQTNNPDSWAAAMACAFAGAAASGLRAVQGQPATPEMQLISVYYAKHSVQIESIRGEASNGGEEYGRADKRCRSTRFVEAITRTDEEGIGILETLKEQAEQIDRSVGT